MLLAALQIRHFIYFARAFIFSARAFTGSSRELGRIPPRVLHFSALVVDSCRDLRYFHSRCGIGEERSLGDDTHL